MFCLTCYNDLLGGGGRERVAQCKRKKKEGGGWEVHCSFKEFGLQVYLGDIQEESFGIYMVGIQPV